MTVPKAAFLMGLPGSGKGTQATLLERRHGFAHLETGPIIDEQFAARAGEPLIELERAKKEAGDLVDTDLVLIWMLRAIRARAAERRSIVFSGSPRTVLEAEVLCPFIASQYGLANVSAFHLRADPATAAKLCMARRVCTANRHPVPADHVGDACPTCGDPLIVRKDDADAATVLFRQRTFDEQTAPVIGYLRQWCGITEVPVVAGDPEASYARIRRVLEWSDARP